ncbi:hypothetical protein L6164_025629 [Bauhinia variegata]|uniref:Uncharacterized protein n=1 Tax=Bauhinia variegata TaxID=167791 RepID=A0ACB9M164_BAUVA|nr:hypothetical protein L6164_025629 [Bauhinia variegata]
MVSLEPIQGFPRSIDAPSSPRMSFSAEFLDENSFISISPHSEDDKDQEKAQERARNAEFEFLSNNVSKNPMLTADELFFEGKLLPYCQIQHLEKFSKMSLQANKDGEEGEEEKEEKVNKEEIRVNWFDDDDPSPRPPKCTVLWKELLRLKKQRASSLSPSSSSLSSSSSSSLADIATKEGKEGKHVKSIKGLERTKSASVSIRPMINVPICTQIKSSAFPPLFPLRKGRLERSELRKIGAQV